MKNLKVIIIAGAIFIWLFFAARSDYEWADAIIEQETDKGWTIVVQQDNFIDIMLPWTWVKTPVTGLWFIESSHTRKLNRGVYLIHILRVSYDYSQTDREESWELINIRTEGSKFIDSPQHLSTIDIGKLQWHKYEVGTPGYQIIQYMVSYDRSR